MPEYIEREVALKIVTDMMCDCNVTHKGRAIRRNIKQIPIADVVEVVRCKDCKYWHNDTDCRNVNGLHSVVLNGERFCASGQKKEGVER